MEQAIKDILNNSIIGIKEPLLNALNEINPFDSIYLFLNNLINSILNMFGTNQNTIQIDFNNELIAESFSTIIIIVLIKFIISLMVKGIKLIVDNIEEINPGTKTKGWRSQWKRKK